MIITVKFVGALRHASNKDKMVLECRHNISLMDLINETTLAAPDLRCNLLDEQLMPPKPNSLILINGREISVLKGLETTLNDSDEVVFVPVVHGG